jgi:hypothetical protein
LGLTLRLSWWDVFDTSGAGGGSFRLIHADMYLANDYGLRSDVGLEVVGGLLTYAHLVATEPAILVFSIVLSCVGVFSPRVLCQRTISAYR